VRSQYDNFIFVDMLVFVGNKCCGQDRCIWGDICHSIGPTTGRTSAETAARMERVLADAWDFVDHTVPVVVEYTVWGLHPGQA